MTGRAAATRAGLATFFAAMAVASCGGASGPPSQSANGSTNALPAAGAVADGGGSIEGALPSFDALAARGPSDAPLMRETARIEGLSEAVVLARAERDACVRAVFASSREVRIWFSDEAGGMRGEASRASSGAVPPRGPACAKKGESLRLVVDDPTASVEAPRPAVRAVIFRAP